MGAAPGVVKRGFLRNSGLFRGSEEALEGGGAALYRTSMSCLSGVLRKAGVWFFAMSLALSALSAKAHQIDAVEFEFQADDQEWRLLSEVDIAFMLPELRTIPGEAPLSRKAVMSAGKPELERMRKATEETMKKLLKLTFAEKVVPWTISFPDFETDPFTLPDDAGDTALFSIRIVTKALPGPGVLRAHWTDDQSSEFIAVNDEAGDAVLTTPSGGSVILLRVAEGKAPEPAKTNLGDWVASGFRHVLPLGLDHLLFIVGLFLMRPKWKPLALQSLLFTIAHSVTLALAVLGLVTVPSKPVEIFIAASIAWIGIENLVSKDPGKFRYIIVFVFGLVHGLGFASVLGEKLEGVPKEKLVTPLLGFNVGVEVAQITVLSICFMALWPLRKWTRQVRIAGSCVVALAGIGWVIERVFFSA